MKMKKYICNIKQRGVHGPHKFVWIKATCLVVWVINVVGYGDLECLPKI